MTLMGEHIGSALIQSRNLKILIFSSFVFGFVVTSTGIGIAATTGSRKEEDDNFGICALCSIGPILTVLIMGLFYDAQSTGYEFETPATGGGSGGTRPAVSVGLLPILPRGRDGRRPAVLGDRVDSFPYGSQQRLHAVRQISGRIDGALPHNWILVPICFAVGACVVVAEPAVHVLTKQVEESGGASFRAISPRCF
jgi:hypothetical protein